MRVFVCMCVCACICVCSDICLLCYLMCRGVVICVIISTLPDNRKLFDRGFWQIHFFKLGVQSDIIVYIYLHFNTCINIYTHMAKQKFCIVQNMNWKIWSFNPSASIFAPSYQVIWYKFHMYYFEWETHTYIHTQGLHRELWYWSNRPLQVYAPVSKTMQFRVPYTFMRIYM